VAGVVIDKNERVGLARFVSRLFRENSSFALAAGSGLIAPAVGLLVSPILTRLYSPSEFGVLGTFAAIMAAGLSLISLRYEISIPLPSRDEEAYALTLAAIKIALAGAVIATVAFIAGAPFVFESEMVSQLMPYIWWLPLALFLAGATQALTQFAVRRGQFGELAAARLVQGLSGPAVQIGAGAMQFGVSGLLIGQAVSQTGGMARLWRSFRKVGKTFTSIPPAMELLKRYKRFPRLSLLPAFLNSLGLQLPVLVIGRTHGIEAAGLVALIFRVVGGPLAIFSSAGGQVLLSEGAKLRRENRSTVGLINKSLRRQALVYAPFILAVPLLPWLFPKIFGARWEAAGWYALALGPALAVRALFSPMDAILDIYERQDLHLVREIVRTVILIGCVIAAKLLGGSVWTIVTALSIGLAANAVFGYLLTIHTASRAAATAA
jgi:O-antigen/teichoic acid export membrane protein